MITVIARSSLYKKQPPHSVSFLCKMSYPDPAKSAGYDGIRNRNLLFIVIFFGGGGTFLCGDVNGNALRMPSPEILYIASCLYFALFPEIEMTGVAF
jgi:hypothetical protein